MRTIYADKDTKGQRIDKFLLKYMNNMPRSFLYKMLRKKNIKLNGKRAEGSEIINDGDKIDIYIAEDKIGEFIKEEKIEKTGRDFSVIYEDENIIVCNKPTGLPVQGDDEHKKNSLNDQLIYYMYEKGEYNREEAKGGKPSICNRLDRNTSGIVLFGKKFAALQAINEALKENGIDKFYMTVVKGNIENEREIKLYHRKEENKKVRIEDSFFDGAKEIITKIKPVKKLKNATVCEVKLITGKTHQIRAVFEYIGNPIIGELKYGDEKNNRYYREKYGVKNQLLHCYKVIFKDIGNDMEYMRGREFLAEMPYIMEKIVKGESI